MTHHKLRFTLITSLIAGIVGLAPALQAANEDSVSSSSRGAKTQSYAISVDATTLESYTRSSLDWTTHAAEITRMKNDINAAGMTVTALNDSKNQAAALCDRDGSAFCRICARSQAPTPRRLSSF